VNTSTLLSNNLFLKNLLCTTWISSKFIKFFIGGILLCNLQLSSNFILNSVFILGLYRLCLTEYITKFSCEGPINSLFNSCFRFILIALFTFVNIFCHIVQFILDAFLIYLVFTYECAYLIR